MEAVRALSKLKDSQDLRGLFGVAEFFFMKTVARCCCAGLPLAALARLGGEVEESWRRSRRATSFRADGDIFFAPGLLDRHAEAASAASESPAL